MSRLRILLSTASRQYANLTMNKSQVSASVLKTNLHISACLKRDTAIVPDNESDQTEKSEETHEVKTSKLKGFQDGMISQDLVPGGEYIPTTKVYEHLIDGQRYDKLPSVYIKATNQNTIASANLGPRNTLSYQSGGKVGFKNAKKRSSVCGQTVGLAVGMDLVKKGYKNVRVIVSGQGAGRFSCMKGIQIAGVNIVAITDTTFPDVSNRPRGPRRL